MNDAYIQEVEVLRNFASGIERTGAAISADILSVVGYAYDRLRQFETMVGHVRDACRKAEEDFDRAAADLEDARRAYESCIGEEDYSASQADYLWHQVRACETALSVARDRVQKARADLQRAQDALQSGTQTIMSIISAAQGAGPAIGGRAAEVAGHVRRAAGIISQYND